MGLVADLPVGILPAVGQAIPMIGGVDQVVGVVSLNLAERRNHMFTTSVPNPLGGWSIGPGSIGLLAGPDNGAAPIGPDCGAVSVCPGVAAV